LVGRKTSDVVENTDESSFGEGHVQSWFFLSFGQPLVETEVAVRSQIVKKIHHKIHKIT
jgi:hypothetical protein